MNYKEQYSNPLWQKKRLFVLEGHNWSCCICDEKKKTLHVHHKKYIDGRNIWDYEYDDLTVLCDDCHKKIHEAISNITTKINENIPLLDLTTLNDIVKSIEGIILGKLKIVKVKNK
jgi:5-methylcytosine-specific restriction endonuclease McrA